MKPHHLNRYEVLSELGRGSMGVVYKAQDPVIDRTVAIKTICLEEPGSETDAWRQRFYREAKSAGRLNHPNIVTIYDVGESEDVAYIAMEFLGGQSLREILDSGTVLPPDTIAGIAAQVAEGLAFAHQNGVVHRDIKPANIMVLESGVVKITDFGIARLPSGTRTVAGTIFGSPKYISPERLQGLDVDGRSDIFSLGAVLYEMLTGFPPFFGSDLSAIMHQVIEVMPAPPSTRNRRIPPSFDYIVAKALAKRPEDRYHDGAEMAADLRNFADLEPPVIAKSAEVIQEPSPAGPSWRVAEPAPPLYGRALAATNAALAALRVKVLAFARDPRFPTRAISGLAAVVLIALASWSLLPGGASNVAAPAAPVASANAGPAVTENVIPAAATTGVQPHSELPVIVAQKASPPGNVAPKASVPDNVAQKASAPDNVVQKASAPDNGAQKTSVPDKPLHRVALAVTPWGEVFVNGKKVGISPPMVDLKLAPGKYAIEIRNSTFEPYRETVDIQNATNVKIKHRFQ